MGSNTHLAESSEVLWEQVHLWNFSPWLCTLSNSWRTQTLLMHGQIPSHQTHSLCLSLLPLPPPPLRCVGNPDPLWTHTFTDHESRQTQATRLLQTSGFMKNQQEERSLDSLEEIFVSVPLYFLLTAKKSDGDFQRSSRLTNDNHKAHTDRKGKKSSVPSRACVKAAVRIWLTAAHLTPHQVYSSPFCADIRIYFGLWKHEMQSTC